MNNTMRLAIRNLCVAMIAALSAATAARASDAVAGIAAPASLAAPQPLQELGEIRVRGKHLAAVVSDAEDDFFQLYNQLNRNDDYDVTCGSMALRPGSVIMKRTCMPAFLADYVAYSTPPRSCGPMEEGEDYGGQRVFYAVSCSQAPQIAMTSKLVLFERRKAYADNVVAVVSSDARLQKMVAHLSDLYSELASVQQHYTDARSAAGLPESQPAAPNHGPRVQ